MIGILTCIVQSDKLFDREMYSHPMASRESYSDQERFVEVMQMKAVEDFTFRMAGTVWAKAQRQSRAWCVFAEQQAVCCALGRMGLKKGERRN